MAIENSVSIFYLRSSIVLTSSNADYSCCDSTGPTEFIKMMSFQMAFRRILQQTTVADPDGAQGIRSNHPPVPIFLNIP